MAWTALDVIETLEFVTIVSIVDGWVGVTQKKNRKQQSEGVVDSSVDNDTALISVLIEAVTHI